jgi:DNA polymerase-3 subunit delta'
MKHMFDHILGNERNKSYLTTALERKMVGNSWLFAGPDGIGKSLFAEAFAKALIGIEGNPKTHPDVRIYLPEGKVGMHSIAKMREFTEEVYLSPAVGSKRIFIIHDADRMLPTSANALLKTFEEPLEDAVIILLSSLPGSLLPTVLSRCRTLYFQPLPAAEIENYLVNALKKSPEEASKIAGLSLWIDR